ncbi:uncharacterized protein LOC111457668 isoform X2 [Cucurbita moschata]|uniref:Uncharacterized protein LOC111457668 isoform X2 n=1 Tax=Cucurbita moschata TaxID=3662 RepID=A0A6J1GW07_CUCMO|nr:uncharacterized protein LOC111457668 isoform X2 [Cucurbita moschata]
MPPSIPPDMTMVAALNHLSKHPPCGGPGGGDHLMNGGPPICDQYSSSSCIGSNPPMADDDDSSPNSLHHQSPSNTDHDAWLQLSIGRVGVGGDQYEIPRTTSPLVELDLLPGSPEAVITSKTETEIETGIRMPLCSSFNLTDINVAQTYPSTSTMLSSSSFHSSIPSIRVDAMAAGTSSDIRIINPPRRPGSGIWFTLKALENQRKQPFLPQISKSYLRIKDEKIKVRLIMKYLVNKLNLDTESEVEIRCRGQEVVPFWTLADVRDRIWCSSSSDSPITCSPHSSTLNHLMLLHYGRKD